MDFQHLWSNIVEISRGFDVTLTIFIWTLVFSIPLGLLLAILSQSKSAVVRKCVGVYTWVLRGTPLMLQVMFIYFLLPHILPFRIDRFWAAILAFVINYAAYFAEIFRGGISSIPVGQREAAQTLGLSRAQTFFSVLLPQTAKRVLLPVTNEVITLVKDTALASTIAVADLMSQAERQVSNSSSIEPYIVAMLIYLVINGVVEQLCKLAERKFNYYQ